MNERLNQLLAFYEEDPDDPFNAYALALEYLKMNAADQAQLYLEYLLKQHPDYVPTYYQAAKFYEAIEEEERAEEIYQKGLKICKVAQNSHAEKELQQAYELFLLNNSL